MALQFTPESIVYLLNVPMSADQKNQIDFASVGAQSAYFQSRIVRSFTDFTYQRKDNIVRVPVEADAIWNCNYVMYQNANFTNKWFYAFVTEIEYRNDGCTWLHLKTDVFQTWMFNFAWKDSFIVREHVSDDEIGKHTIPENIPIGDPKVQTFDTMQDNFQSRMQFDTNYWACIICSKVPSQIPLPSPVPPQYASGIPSCAYFLGVEPNALQVIVDLFNSEGIADAITNIVPVLRSEVIAMQLDANCSLLALDATTLIFPKYKDITPNLISIDGYVPKNKKCFCYPYHYALVSNHAGQEVILKYEWMSEYRLRCEYLLSANPALYVYPEGYSAEIAEDIGVTFANYPQIPWTYDSFKNWVALNGNTLATNLISTTAGAAISAGTGNIAGIASSTLSITSEIGQMMDRMAVPKTIKGSISGNANMQTDSACITCYEMVCRNEYIKIVDQYFSRYGYRVNEVKTPDLRSRPAWNYIETRDCILDCDCPEDDAHELESIFNSGVTIWHTAAGYGNYDQNNS